MVISLLIPLISASSLSIQAPSSVALNEELNVSLSYETAKTYDVKIYVHNSSDSRVARSEILSDIWNSGWKDSWLYITSAFPSQTSFKIKVNAFALNAQICAQLRETEKKAISQKACMPIEILDNPISENNAQTEETENASLENSPNSQETQDTENSSNEETEKDTASKTIQQLNEVSINSDNKISSNVIKQEDVFVLNQKSKKQVIKTNESTLFKGIIYAFIILCVLLVTMIIARKF